MSAEYMSMREMTEEDFREFVRTHEEVEVENTRILIGPLKPIKEYQPKQLQLERINAWSFPERGKWATHRGNFRRNCPPQMAWNLILRY